MFRLIIIIAVIIIILIIFRSRRNKISKNQDIYKILIFVIIVGAAVFFLATSGKFIIPQLMQIIKMALPLLTKFIGV